MAKAKQVFEVTATSSELTLSALRREVSAALKSAAFNLPLGVKLVVKKQKPAAV